MKGFTTEWQGGQCGHEAIKFTNNRVPVPRTNPTVTVFATQLCSLILERIRKKYTLYFIVKEKQKNLLCNSY